MMMKCFLRLAAVILLMLPLFSCNLIDDDNPGQNNLVIIRDNSFSPQTIQVNAGRVVLWRHDGSSPHTVTSGTPATSGRLFDSGNLNPGGSFEFTFSSPGSYVYYCKIHGTMMSGTVNVQ